MKWICALIIAACASDYFIIRDSIGGTAGEVQNKTFITIFITGLTVVVVTVGIAHFSNQDRGPLPVANLAAIASLATIVLALSAAGGYLARGASSPTSACRNAIVRNAPEDFVTGGEGAAASSGPGQSYSTVETFTSSCEVGVSGYCIGAFVQDQGSPFVDARWLKLYRLPGEWVPAADSDLASQSLQFNLLADCPQMGGAATPGTPSLSVSKRALMLSPLSHSQVRDGYRKGGFPPNYVPAEVGVSLIRVDSSPTSPVILSLGLANGYGGGQGYVPLSEPLLRPASKGWGYLLATDCDAPGNPSATQPRYYKVTLSTGNIQPVLQTELPRSLMNSRALSDKADPADRGQRWLRQACLPR